MVYEERYPLATKLNGLYKIAQFVTIIKNHTSDYWIALNIQALVPT